MLTSGFSFHCTRHDSGCRRSLLVVAACDGLDLGQEVAELALVDLHAGVEVEADLRVGGMLPLFL
jgi:hypothetical protein